MTPARELPIRPLAAATVAALLLATACKVVEPTIPDRASEQARRPTPPTVPVEFEESSVADGPSEDLPEEVAEPPRIGDDRVVSFEMRGMPLAEAIHMIAESAQVNIYLDAELDRLVDASFPAVTLDSALHVLLQRNGLLLVEEPEGVYWVERADGSQRDSAWFRLQSIDAASILDDLDQLVADESVLVVNEEQNFVLVDGTAHDVELVASYLQGVDRLKAQVLLEMEIVELILDEDFELAIAHAIEDGALGGPGDPGNTASFLQSFTTLSDEFSVSFTNPTTPLTSTLRALESYGAVNLVSSPRVLTVTQQPATVAVTTEVPFINATTSTEVGGGQAGSATVQQVEFKQVGVDMQVTPTVQEGGVVQIQIAQELSEVVDFFQGIPVVDTRNLDTMMMVGDGQTAVIGGLLQNRVTEADAGVPILMDVPWIGRLFRQDSESSQKRVLLLFLTPRRLDPDQASRLARELRAEYSETVRLSGAHAAEDL